MKSRKNHAHMGQVVVVTRVATSDMDPRRARNVILLLAFSMALLMTGYAIIMPLFARRLDEFGSGANELALMSTAYALAGIVAAPFMGALADRAGRRPLVLGSLLAFALANVGFLLATSTEMLIVLRALEGALSAGLGPAAMGIVADIAPENQRARWIGVVMGGGSAGWVLGPVVGGVLYDVSGFEAPFMISAGVSLLAFIAAAVLIPETRPRKVWRREALRQRRVAALAPAQAASLRAALPRPLSTFATLLLISFVMYFAWAFFEPRLLFFVFDDLGWTTTRFGVAAGGYGLASLLGQTTLGQMGDRFGRRPSIALGLLLFAAQFAGVVFTTSFGLIMLSFAIAGLGEGLASPALGAFFLDISEEQHRSRVMGINASASALGGVVGPLLAAAAGSVSPQSAFAGGAAVVIGAALLALVVLKATDQAAEGARARVWDISDVRALAAQASLRGVVRSAAAARKLKGTL
jgi:multidrug resistance protein